MYNSERYMCLESKLLCVLFKFRSSCLPLAIKTGRHENIPNHKRLCNYCNMNVIENEYHFLLVCPAYSVIRKQYIPRYFIQWPCLNKFYSLSNTNSLLVLKKIALYILKALEVRCETVLWRWLRRTLKNSRYCNSQLHFWYILMFYYTFYVCIFFMLQAMYGFFAVNSIQYHKKYGKVGRCEARLSTVYVHRSIYQLKSSCGYL